MSSHSIQANRRPSGVHFQQLLDFSAGHFKTIRDAGDGTIIATMLQKQGLIRKLEYLHAQHKRPNPKVYTMLINKSKEEPFHRISDLFRSIISYKLANIFTYNAYIIAARQAGALQEAKKAFEEAKRHNIANIITYNSYMTAADHAGEFQEAKKAFEEAQRHSLANSITYTTYMTAAAHSGVFQEAKKAFEATQIHKMANDVTYSAYIDCLVAADKMEEAKILFNQQIKVPQSLWKERISYNLHNFSYGVGRMLIRKLQEEVSKPEEVIVITGRGNKLSGNFL